jgi:hypothetical protein
MSAIVAKSFVRDVAAVLIPSPCTQGEGEGGGSSGESAFHPHPNPPPGYMGRGKEGSPEVNFP